MPFSYLGLELHSNRVLVQLRTDNLTTLNDFQKLLGDIQWLRPYLKLPTADLLPLYDILRGPSEPTSPRQLTPAAHKFLSLITRAISSQASFQIVYSLPLVFVVLSTPHVPTGVLWQSSPSTLRAQDKLKGHSLLWIHMPASHTKVIPT